MKNCFLVAAVLLLVFGLSGPTGFKAQDGPGYGPGYDPGTGPGPESAAPPGVARVSMVQGDVGIMRGDAGEWISSTVNTPVSPGDHVATSDQSRAEVQLDFANVLHLDQRTEVRIADLEPRKIQVQVSSGLVDLSIFSGSEAEIEIDTPNMSVHPLAEGVYRVEVDSPTQTQLIVRVGRADVFTPQGSQEVEGDQVMFVQGEDNPVYRIDRAPGWDEFDKWVTNRDQQIGNAQAFAHTDRYYTGSSDLGGNGQWDQVPGYDWCWTPAVDAGWVPYRYGRWDWQPYWGWTWISAEPWGWAPYHYGRWFSYGGRWRWWPGMVAGGLRPAWGPAYVSFLGFGGGGLGLAAAGFGFASIGWLPLGPFDVFRPWWGVGHSFNVLNFNEFYGHRGPSTTLGGRPFGSNLEAVMRDGRMRGAITNVSARDFVSGRMGHFQPVTDGMLRNASVVRGTLPMAPTRESLGMRVGARANFGFGRMNGQHFYSRSAAPMGRRSSFSAEAGQMRSMVQRGASMQGRPGGYTGNAGFRPNPMGAERMAGQGGQGNPGWERFSGGNPSGRWPAGVNMGGTHGGEMAAPGREGYGGRPPGNPNNWQRFNSRAPMGGPGLTHYEGRPGWNSPAPRSGYRGGGRPPIQLNHPIMRERSSGGGGGRVGGGHTYSAPHGGGGGHGGGGHGGGRR